MKTCIPIGSRIGVLCGSYLFDFCLFFRLIFLKFQRFRSKYLRFRPKSIRFCLILKDFGSKSQLFLVELDFGLKPQILNRNIKDFATKSQRFRVEITNISGQNNKHFGYKSQTFRVEISHISEEFRVKISLTLG